MLTTIAFRTAGNWARCDVAGFLPRRYSSDDCWRSNHRYERMTAEAFQVGLRSGEAQTRAAWPTCRASRLMAAANVRRLVLAGSAFLLPRWRQPRTPQDLTEHACINLRPPTHGGFYVWEFRKSRHELKVRVQGRAVFNAVAMIRDAALEGLGYLPEDPVETAIQKGGLVRVPADWCPPRPGDHLLPEPPPTLASFRVRGRCAPSPNIKVVSLRSLLARIPRSRLAMERPFVGADQPC